MKRILLPAGGAVLATGLLAAGLAGTAQAAPDWATDPMAKNTAEAQSVVQFWTKSNNEALKRATAYYADVKVIPKLNSKGGPTTDGKPGIAPPIGGEKVVTAKVKNINLPKSIGKVFFVDGKGEYKWCSATSIQSKYRNLVATAGHCVYDADNNGHVMDNWVFVPGYYQGKTPWGIYVGKQAWTHYDFDVYEDYDKDYAFVTVYNGVHFNGAKQVTAEEYAKFIGPKYLSEKEITKAEYEAAVVKYGLYGPAKIKGEDGKATTERVGHDYTAKPKVLAQEEVTLDVWAKAPASTATNVNGEKLAGPGAGLVIESVTESEWNAFNARKAAGKELGQGLKGGKVPGTDIELPTGWWVVKTYVKQWYLASAVSYWFETYHIELSKDAGRLGDNVGGQGFAWNQKTGQAVYVFGYPSDAHGDGDKSFTGVTPKWCYGKTSAKSYVSAAHKVEEQVGLKCSMTPGADGSPWLIKYSSAKRVGYVNGVTSLFGDQDGNGRYDLSTSAYFDGETADIYKKAANVWSGKIVGPNGELYK
ncbi:hypothetical protein HS041_31110 [Planomonospora sp. ID67723]|uniref:hypothetical protein n=1 Tax=Planomonospora sp. ID67723 TaxID=2738134 RepID=UPI0018C436EA|nr:hypothetical protein [Planomonospora sp. ID67723]MBG0832158.1 hypothetical protein [Planomonospora sp. ID67723]